MGEARRRKLKEQRLLKEKQAQLVKAGSKVDTKALQNELLSFWHNKVGTAVSRQEYYLLYYSIMSSNKSGFVKFFSNHQKNDFVLSTYKTLREKIIALFPDLQLDNEIRFFHNASQVLETQEEVDAYFRKLYSGPTPFNRICVSKDLSIRWFQHTDDGNIGVMHWKATKLFAKSLSKSILNNATTDRFSWTDDKHKCSIEITTHSDFKKLTSDLVDHKSKPVREGLSKLQEIAKKAFELEESCIVIFFHTKQPASDKSNKDNSVDSIKKEPIYFTQSELKQRGWTTRLIEKYLGEPDTYFNNIYNRYCPTHGYEIPKVKKIESTKAFKAEREHYRKK